jgi:hypothetical protein
MSTSASSTPPAEATELWTLRGLIATHKAGALAIVALIATMLATFVFVALGAHGRGITDSSTCTAWGSANQNRQSAYARLYLSEHGPVPRWGASPAAVIHAINWGCGVAFGDDVSDTATVVQAISGNF